MSGYEITEKDIDAVVKWLEAYHPEKATRDYATEMLLALKASYRKLASLDLDTLEEIYKDLDK